MPDRIRLLTRQFISKPHTSLGYWLAAAVQLRLRWPTWRICCSSIKPGVVGVGTFNPTGGPRANLMGTGFAVLDGHYVVSCAHTFSKPLNSEKKEIYAVFLGHDRQVSVRAAEVDRHRQGARSGLAENFRRPDSHIEDRRLGPGARRLAALFHRLSDWLGARAQSVHPPCRPRRHHSHFHADAEAPRS